MQREELRRKELRKLYLDRFSDDAIDIFGENYRYGVVGFDLGTTLYDHICREAGDFVSKVRISSDFFDEEKTLDDLFNRFGRASWSVANFLRDRVWDLDEEDQNTIRKNTEIFNITHVQRYFVGAYLGCLNFDQDLDLSLLEQNLKNWKDPNKEKPVAVFVLNQNDHHFGYAEAYKQIVELKDSHNVYVFEADNSYLAQGQIAELNSHLGRLIDVLVVGGHGSDKGILMGNSYYSSSPYITGAWFDDISYALADDAIVVADACNIAKDEDNMFSNRNDERTYFAAKGISHGFEWVKEDGLVTGVEFNCEEGTACYGGEVSR